MITGDKEFTLDVNGAVWSLNGDTEIIDQISANFKLDGDEKCDEEDLEVTPTKRMKLSDDNVENLKKSPEIIDESCSSKGGKNASEIVNIHGKVFDVCPYSGQSKNSSKQTKNDKNADCPVSRKFDPIKMPIGQDFMGECPVLSTEQKITFDSGADGGGDNINCPVSGNFTGNVTSEAIDKCPFLQKAKNDAVELIDYEENAKVNPKQDPKSLVDNLPDVKLYCGFFCHRKTLKSIFDKCEDVGVKLAEKLISAGALEVMKVAQNEIHSKC